MLEGEQRRHFVTCDNKKTKKRWKKFKLVLVLQELYIQVYMVLTTAKCCSIPGYIVFLIIMTWIWFGTQAYSP